MFKIGGSAVVLFGASGNWRPSDDILLRTPAEESKRSSASVMQSRIALRSWLNGTDLTMKRFDQGSDVTVFEDLPSGLACSTDGNIDHGAGQIVCPDDLIGKHYPEYGID